MASLVQLAEEASSAVVFERAVLDLFQRVVGSIRKRGVAVDTSVLGAARVGAARELSKSFVRVRVVPVMDATEECSPNSLRHVVLVASKRDRR